MAISRFSTSRVGAGLPKYQKLWDGTTLLFDSDFELIERVTVGSGGAGSITFSSIPQTYKHLQVRMFTRATTDPGIDMYINGDTGASASYHYFYGNGTDVLAGSAPNNQNATYYPANGSLANTFGPAVIDILDYTATNKNKTWKNFFGYDTNGSGQAIGLSGHGTYSSTAAVTSLLFRNYYGTGYPIAEYSQIALYGIKGTA
jgi:hypothetical protein